MFYLRNFKNFAEAELDLERPTTLLVGPNGSGKSNLVEGVELLSFLAGGHRLHEITDIGREGGIEVRGGLEACARSGHDQFVLGLTAAVPLPEATVLAQVQYEISVCVRPEPRIASESLKVEGRHIPVFEVIPAEAESSSADNQVRYDNNDRGRIKPVESIAADRSALSQYPRFAHRNKELPEALALMDALLAKLEVPGVFDPMPKLMRGFERMSETQMARNGYNISPVLFSLWAPRPILKQSPDGKTIRVLGDRRDVLKRILKRVAQLPDEPFSDFDFIRTKKGGDVRFGFRTVGNGETIDARLLSDGTLRALAILTALEISKAGTRLILEEFDNGVHPSRVPILSEALFECAERNNLSVLATTHNPATMNALSREQLGGVLLLVADRAPGTGRLVSLQDLPGYVEFVERGRLGDLVTRRVYEQHLRPNYEEARRADIEQWINSLP